MTAFIIILSTYLGLGTAVALIVHRSKQTQDEFYLGGRRFSGVLSSLTYAATTYSAFMMVGLVGLAFASGIGAMIFELTYLAGTVILLSIYGKRLWLMSKEKGIISPADLFTDRYGSPTGGISAIIALVALIPYTASQVIGISIVFEMYGGISFTAAVAIAVGTIALWASIGGLRGVAITDAIQGVFMVVVAVLAVVLSHKEFGGFHFDTFPNAFWTPIHFINLTLPWFFFALTNPQVLQRIFIPRDRHSLNRMILLFTVFGILYTCIVCFIGFAARYAHETGRLAAIAGRDNVINAVMDSLARWIALPIAFSIIFAAVSTANSIILTLSSMVQRSITGKNSRLWIGKLLILGLSLAVLLFSLTRPGYIVELSVSSSAILLCFLPLIFGLFHWKRGGRITAIVTLCGGSAAALIFHLLKLPLSSVYTFATVFMLFFITSALEG